MLKFARHHPSPTGVPKRSSSADRGTRHSLAQTALNSVTTTLNRSQIQQKKQISLETATSQRRSRTSSLERVSMRDTVPSPLSSNESSTSFTRGISVMPAMTRTATTTESPAASPAGARTANIVPTSYARSHSPPPPLPQKSLISSFVRQTTKDILETTKSKQKNLEIESNYEAIFSGTLCRGQANTSIKPTVPSRPTICSAASSSQKQQAAEATATLLIKSGLKKDFYVNNHLYEPRSDFHRAVVQLVEKMDLPHLDTSSESGYGSDQDSINNLINMVATGSTTITTTTTTTSTSDASCPPPPPLPIRGSRSRTLQSSLPPKEKKSVRFDSYVMLLQGLRERNLDLVRIHVREVCDEALATEEVINEFLTAVIEGNEPLIREMLANGFNVNASDPAGMTPLHLAATFNYLPLVRLLLSHGASVFARTHSSGNIPSELSSRRLPGFQACHAYLRCMEECLGVANSGRVHVTQPYRTCRCDELGVVAGETLTVIRKGDYAGSSWWWCENLDGHQGYVLQDLLALNKPTASIVR